MAIDWYASRKRAQAIIEKIGKARTMTCIRRISLSKGSRTRRQGFCRDRSSRLAIRTPTAMGQNRTARCITGVKKSELMKPSRPTPHPCAIPFRFLRVLCVFVVKSSSRYVVTGGRHAHPAGKLPPANCGILPSVQPGS